MLRVRQITDNLSFDKLEKSGIIPSDLEKKLENSKAMLVKKYPPFVYATKDFSTMGFFMDYVIRAGIRIHLSDFSKVSTGVDPISEIISSLPDEQMLSVLQILNLYETSINIHDVVSSSLEIIKILLNKTFNKSDITKYIPTLQNIIKEIVKQWKILIEPGDIKFNEIINYKQIQGHPDILTNTSILDIKNSSSFRKMSKTSFLQLLAYYSIYKEYNKDIKNIGFVLPMQREIVILNLEDWNHKSFLNILEKQSNPEPLISKIIFSDDIKYKIYEIYARYNIGSHFSKGKDIACSFQEYILKHPRCPGQMFLGNPRTGRRNPKTETKKDLCREIIVNTGFNYFTHAAYIINLCKNDCDEGDFWQQRYLNEDLIFTSYIGGKGVVVHTGSKKGQSEESALDIMEIMVRKSLSYATEGCPLLLETPCGEKNEVCTDIESLSNFFFRFTLEERKKLGLCLDTCHTFASGIDPLEYLEKWKLLEIPIKLVHLNDSATPFGSKVDRHAMMGIGYIGFEKMMRIVEFCYNHGIPMVTE